MTAVPELLPTNLADKNAEYAVLGAMLTESDAIAEAHEIVKPEHFYHQGCQTLYRAILALFERAVDIDPVTLCDELGKRDQLQQIGGTSFVFEVANSVFTAANIRPHAEIMLKHYRHRRLAGIAESLKARLSTPVEDSDELMQWAETEILAIRDNESLDSTVRVGEVAGAYVERIDELRQSGRPIAGLSTGYRALDELTGGLMPTETTVIAARPGVGKSAFALNVAYNIAFLDLYLKERIPVLFFSLEMSREQILKRLYSMITELHGSRIRHARLSDGEMQLMYQETNRIVELPRFINDRAGLNAIDIMMVARRYKRRYGIRLIVVDYLQIMGSHQRGLNREREVGANAEFLKNMAKQLDCAMLIVSQLNRGLESRPNPTPRLSDLRESGAIEQAANCIMFLHPETELTDGKVTETGRIRVLVEKYRDDACGERLLTYVGELTLFQE